MAKKKAGAKKKIPPRINLFGPPSLLEGESEAAYNSLSKRVTEAIKPTDIIEEFAVRDVVNGMWDSLRLARFKPELLKANMHKGLHDILLPLCNPLNQLERRQFDGPKADRLSDAWAMRDSSATEEVEQLLDDAELTMDAVIAQTLSENIDAFERIDRMAINADARRHVALREIDRRREAVRQDLRAAVRPYREPNTRAVEYTSPVIEAKVIEHASPVEVDDVALADGGDEIETIEVAQAYEETEADESADEGEPFVEEDEPIESDAAESHEADAVPNTSDETEE